MRKEGQPKIAFLQFKHSSEDDESRPPHSPNSRRAHPTTRPEPRLLAEKNLSRSLSHPLPSPPHVASVSDSSSASGGTALSFFPYVPFFGVMCWSMYESSRGCLRALVDFLRGIDWIGDWILIVYHGGSVILLHQWRDSGKSPFPQIFYSARRAFLMLMFLDP